MLPASVVASIPAESVHFAITEIATLNIILEVDGNKVSNPDDLLNVLEQHQPGDTVKVITLRNQDTLEFDVELAPPG